MSLRLTFPLLPALAVSVFIAIPFSSEIKATKKPASTVFTGNNVIQFAMDDKSTQFVKVLRAEVAHEQNIFYVNLWMNENGTDRLTIVLKDKDVREGNYELDNMNSGYLSVTQHSHQCIFRTDNYYTGMLMIHQYDTTNNILAASFECIAYSESCEKLMLVKEGRFDVRFNPF